MEEQNAKVLTKTHPKVETRLKLVAKYKEKNKSVNQKVNEERFHRYANN